MGRAPCCDKVGLKKGPWTIEEDQKLTAYINEHGHGSWRALPKKAGLLRCGKSCRLRWTNYLRPDIKRGEFSASEEQTIVQLHALLGNKWSAIATRLPKRTDNEIKNYWNTHLKKRLLKMGLNPATHKPQTPPPPPNIRASSNKSEPAASHAAVVASRGSCSTVTHMAQWESVRLEAEARLAREAEMRAKGLWLRPFSTPAIVAAAAGQAPNMQSTCIAGLTMSMSSTKQEAGGTCTNACANVPLNLTSFQNSPSVATLMASLEQQKNAVCDPNNIAVPEMIQSLQNWENSLQGQAGIMWPDSWKLSNNFMANYNSSNADQGHESSSCSSLSHGSNHSSPTSTLCSIKQLSKNCFTSGNLTPSGTQTRKLCWSNNNVHFSSFSTPLLSHNQLPLRHPPPPIHELYDVLQGAASIKGTCGEGSFLGVTNTLQELMQCADALNDGTEDSLLMDSNPDGFLDDLALVSEDMSSTHESVSADASDGSGRDIRQISYGALLDEDQYTECEWNSVLEGDAEEATTLD